MTSEEINESTTSSFCISNNENEEGFSELMEALKQSFDKSFDKLSESNELTIPCICRTKSKDYFLVNIIIA
jgi:hypothetical protein